MMGFNILTIPALMGSYYAVNSLTISQFVSNLLLIIVTDMYRLESAIRSNKPGWYSDGMEHFAYSHNGLL